MPVRDQLHCALAGVTTTAFLKDMRQDCLMMCVSETKPTRLRPIGQRPWDGLHDGTRRFQSEVIVLRDDRVATGAP